MTYEPQGKPEEVQFGPFRVDWVGFRLTRNGRRIDLPRIAMEVLLFLLRQPNVLVTRAQLSEAIWPGTDPEQKEQSINTAINRIRAALRDDAAKPRYIETVIGKGYRFIAPVEAPATPAPANPLPTVDHLALAPSPELPPVTEATPDLPPEPCVPVLLPQATVEETLPHLAPEAASLEKPGNEAVKRLRNTVVHLASLRSTSRLALAACSLVLIATTLLIGQRSKFQLHPHKVIVQKRRLAVAILGFDSLAGNAAATRTDWIGTALEETLFSEMSADPAIRMIPNGAVDAARASQNLSRTTTLSRESLQQLCSAIGCDLVIVGHYLASGGELRLDVQLQDARTGEVTGAYRQTEREDKLLQIIAGSGKALRAQLGMPVLTEAQETSLQAEQPNLPEALQSYAQGMMRLRVQDAAAAVPLFEHATAIQPDYTLAYVGMSRAYAGMGYDAKAEDAAKHAYELAGTLSGEERLQVEAQYAATAGRWADAVTATRQMVVLVPDELRYKLQLADELIASGDPREALAVASAMQRLPAPDGDDPRVLLARARAYRATGDFTQQAQSAEAAARQAQSRGLTLLQITALLLAGDAIDHLGQHSDARAHFASARSLLQKVDAPALYLEFLLRDADALRKTGELAQAKVELMQAIDRARKVRDHRNLIASLAVLTQVYRREEDLPAQKRITLELLQVTREIGDQRSEAGVLLDLGNEQLNMGNPVAARSTYESGLRIAQQIGALELESRATGNIGILDYMHGQLLTGKTSIEQGLKLSRKLGEWPSVAYKLGHYATVLMYEDKLQEAKAALDERCSLLQRSGEIQDLASCQLSYADLSQQSGDARSGIAPLEAITAKYRTVNPGVHAWLSLARARLEIGDLPAANDAVEHAAVISKGTVNEADFLIPLAIVRGEVEAALNEDASARLTLEWAAARARATHLLPQEWEAQIALANINRWRNAADSRRELQAVASMAHLAGYNSIANRAKAALHSRRAGQS